jgi:hypothetical protein
MIIKAMQNLSFFPGAFKPFKPSPGPFRLSPGHFKPSPGPFRPFPGPGANPPSNPPNFRRQR